jgi:hypothetical protein
MPPRMLRKRKARTIKLEKLSVFEEEIQKNRKRFSERFLAKSQIERAGILAKHYRKVNITRKMLSDAVKLLHGNSVVPDEPIPQKIVLGLNRAEKLYQSLFSEAELIFSKDYVAKFYLGGKVRETHYLYLLHDCIHFMLEINLLKKNLSD